MEYLCLPPGYLTTSMAAKAVGKESATIRDWVRRGILVRCGGSPKRPIFRVEEVHSATQVARPNRPGQRGVKQSA